MRVWMLASLLCVAAVGCSDDPATGGGGDSAPAFQLIADANCDGHVDVAGTSDTDVSSTRPALVLPNLDSDAGDGRMDALTEGVDGPADLRDLTPVAVRVSGTLVESSRLLVWLPPAVSSKAHLFVLDGTPDAPTGATPADASGQLAIDTTRLRSGAVIGVEATALRGADASGWDGTIPLHAQWEGQTEAATPSITLQVAPLVFGWNTLPARTVYHTDVGDDSEPLIEGITPVLGNAVTRQPITQLGGEIDQWAQDFFDVAHVARPGPGGTAVSLRVIVRSPQPDRDAGQQMIRGARGPDVAVIDIHGPLQDDAAGAGYSMSSFGNWDVVPPSANGDGAYPLGRVIHGTGTAAVDRPDPAFARFVEAQEAQAPLTVDSNWLLVAHLDEFLTWVPASTPRGWSLLVARPADARRMLLEMQASGRGRAKLFEGLEEYDFSEEDAPLVDAARTIDQVLADADLMAESQLAQTKIDRTVAALQTEFGLTADEIVPVPFLYGRVFGKALAYQPGTVNLLVVDGRLGIAQPFGPRINGVDPFEQDLTTRLGARGLSVHFVDDWYLYHIEMGEVHCATNVWRDPGAAWRGFWR